MPPPRHTESSILESYLLTPAPLPTILPYDAFLQLVPTQHRSNPHLKRFYRDLQLQRNIDIDTVRQNIEREVSRSATLKAQLARRLTEDQTRHRSNNGNNNAKKRKRPNDTESNDNAEEPNEFTNPSELAIDTTYLTTSLHPAHTDTTLPTPLNHPLTSGTRKHHTRATLLSSLRSACSALETEISDLESESATLLAEMNEIVGSLSDLRYGRFAKPVVVGGGGGGGGGGNGDDGKGDKTVEEEVLDALEGLQRRIGEVVD